jgi:large subunit ribosomal protein L3
MSENKVSLPAIYAQKAGMTRVFDEAGLHVPVTVVKLIPNVISQVKTKETDGYEAYQVAYYEKREKLISSPVKGQLKKGGVDKNLCRFAEIKAAEISPESLGKEVSLENFAAKTMIDVTGTSKGKGFAGVMKRYNFSGGPAAHGSHFHRTTGSIGQHTEPGKIFKGKKMPGHMGVDTKTVQNLEVVELNEEQGYMLIKGSVPGAKNGFIKIAKALKK